PGSHTHAVDQSADAGRISLPTIKDASPMTKHSLTVAVAAALFALAGAPSQAQDKAAAHAKAAAAASPATGKELYPKAYYDLMLKDRLAQGQPDTPEHRTALREEV